MADDLRAVGELHAEIAAACAPSSTRAQRPLWLRRWLQFSLRTALLLTAAAAALMSFFGVPLFRFREQQLAAEKLERCGARLTSESADGWMVRAAEKLFGPEAAKRVTDVAWSDAEIGAADLAPLESLPWVETVGLSWKSVDDGGVSHLRRMRRLTSLNLNGAKITDRGLAHLANCQALQRLNLHGARITDVGLAHLSQLSALENLDISSTKVTGEKLEPLARLPALEVLNLNETPLTDSAVTVLSRLKRLRWLGVSHTRLSDAAREALAAALPTTAIDD